MRRLVWAFGWAGVVVWSIVCAIAYGLFDLVGRAFMRNADSFASDPETVEGIWRAFSWVHGLSTWGVLIAWACVSLMILAVPWVIDRMLSVSRPDPRTVASRRPMAYGSGREGVIDLGPDQYSVGPSQAGTGHPPPLAPPRR